MLLFRYAPSLVPPSVTPSLSLSLNSDTSYFSLCASNHTFNWLTCLRSADRPATISASASFPERSLVSLVDCQSTGEHELHSLFTRYLLTNTTWRLKAIGTLVHFFLSFYPFYSFSSSHLSPHRRSPIAMRPVIPPACQAFWLTLRRSADRLAAIQYQHPSFLIEAPSLLRIVSSLANVIYVCHSFIDHQ